MPASISSLHMTASRWRTWSATTTNITKPTAKIIRTAPTITTPGTWESKDRRTILRSSLPANVRSVISWRPCSCRRAFLCCAEETKLDARKMATTTPIVRTTRSAGTTGIWTSASKSFWSSPARLIRFRQTHPNLRRRKFFQDREVYHPSSRDIAWYRTDGQEMTQEQWNTGWMRSMAVMLNGTTLGQTRRHGRAITDDTFLVMLNSYGDASPTRCRSLLEIADGSC